MPSNHTFTSDTILSQLSARVLSLILQQQQPFLSNRSSTVTDDDQVDHEIIVVQYSCLFLPLIFAVWWYWTRKAAQHVVRRITPILCQSDQTCVDTSSYTFRESSMETTFPSLVTSSSVSTISPPFIILHTTNTEDQFHSWQDVVHSKTTDSSVRRVRWLKGWNPRNKQHHQQQQQRKQRYRLQHNNNNNESNTMLEEGILSTITGWHTIEGIELSALSNSSYYK